MKIKESEFSNSLMLFGSLPSFFRPLCHGLTLSLALAALLQAEKAPLPNIVFILADDMSYDSVSAYNDELGAMQTPRIDKLVEQGMSFSDGHSASAVCTPTRYGLRTGRYCWRTRLKSQVHWPYGQPLLRDE